MIIKPISTPQEIEGKALVHFQAWKEAYTGLISQEYLDKRTLELSLSVAKRAFEGGIAGFAAKQDGRVIGFADYGPCRDEDLSSAGEVYAIYILKEYYGRGVGRALMTHALDAMKEYKQIAVWVLENNRRAVRFYESFGYEPDGREKVLNLGAPVREIRMILKR